MVSQLFENVIVLVRNLSWLHDVGYVLMERICPEHQKTIFCRNGIAKVSDSVHEFGVFGAYFGGGAKGELLNDYCGYLLRTKFAELDEGGITTGNGVFNSPTLI